MLGPGALGPLGPGISGQGHTEDLGLLGTATNETLPHVQASSHGCSNGDAQRLFINSLSVKEVCGGHWEAWGIPGGAYGGCWGYILNIL